MGPGLCWGWRPCHHAWLELARLHSPMGVRARKGACEPTQQAWDQGQPPLGFLRAFSASTVLKKPCQWGTLKNPHRLSIKSLIGANYCDDDLWEVIMCLVWKRLQSSTSPQPEALVTEGRANITASISGKAAFPQKHLVMWETAQGEGKWASRTLGPPTSGAVLLLPSDRGEAPLSPRGVFPAGAEEWNVTIIWVVLKASPPPTSSSGETQVHRRCLTSVRFAWFMACVLLHLHFFLPEDLCFFFLPVENSNLHHGWLHCTIPFSPTAKIYTHFPRYFKDGLALHSTQVRRERRWTGLFACFLAKRTEPLNISPCLGYTRLFSLLR